jgi:hypothetical protein
MNDETAPAPSPERAYAVLVLVKNPEGVPRYELVGTVSAVSSWRAIEQVAKTRHRAAPESTPDWHEETYVAVPTRHWFEATVKAEATVHIQVNRV